MDVLSKQGKLVACMRCLSPQEDTYLFWGLVRRFLNCLGALRCESWRLGDVSDPTRHSPAVQKTFLKKPWNPPAKPEKTSETTAFGFSLNRGKLQPKASPTTREQIQLRKAVSSAVNGPPSASIASQPPFQHDQALWTLMSHSLNALSGII